MDEKKPAAGEGEGILARTARTIGSMFGAVKKKPAPPKKTEAPKQAGASAKKGTVAKKARKKSGGRRK